MLIFIGGGGISFNLGGHMCVFISPHPSFFVVCCGYDSHLRRNLVVVGQMIEMMYECCDRCNPHVVDLST